MNNTVRTGLYIMVFLCMMYSCEANRKADFILDKLENIERTIHTQNETPTSWLDGVSQ